MQSGWHKYALAGSLLFVLAIAGGAFTARATGLFGSGIVEQANGALRERQPNSVQAPAISFIDNPSATCYRPVASANTCYITWNNLNVTASSAQYIVSMTISIDNRLRAYHSGFFQTSMYIPGDLFGPGFQVACGPRGAGGMGNTYAYTVRASETGGLSSANYGSVTCPGVMLVHLPIIRR
jgi:hypothetical protein